MSTIRAFLAINFSVATTRAVVEAQQALRQAVPKDLRVAWVPPANIHLTLKFLGRIPGEATEALIDALAQGLKQRTPFELRARGAGAFPDAARPRVVWVGVEEEGDALTRLWADVEGWMADLGFDREARPFHPHLTLGRVKGSGVSLEEALTPLQGKSFGTSLIREVTLYESRLQARGAEYVVVKRVAFGGAAPASGAGEDGGEGEARGPAATEPEPGGEALEQEAPGASEPESEAQRQGASAAVPGAEQDDTATTSKTERPGHGG